MVCNHIIGWVCVAFLTGLAGCEENTPDYVGHVIDANQRAQPSDSLIKEIPTYNEGRRRGQLVFFYKYLKEQAYALQLDSIELGYDSLQFRVWLGADRAIKTHLLIIRAYKGKWQAELIIITYNAKPKGEGYTESKVQKIVEPRSGWKRFLKKTNDLQIFDLPNCHDGCGADGIIYYFEIATKNKYRFYYYCNPDSVPNYCRHEKNVLIFSEFLEKEFGFRYIR